MKEAHIVIHHSQQIFDEYAERNHERNLAAIEDLREQMDRVVEAARAALRTGLKVYYLEYDIEPYVEMRPLMDCVRSIPEGRDGITQFLRLKEMLIADEVSNVRLTGSEREVCVKALDLLLNGSSAFNDCSSGLRFEIKLIDEILHILLAQGWDANEDDPVIEYEKLLVHLGWSREKLDSVLRAHLESHVLEDLCFGGLI